MWFSETARAMPPKFRRGYKGNSRYLPGANPTQRQGGNMLRRRTIRPDILVVWLALTTSPAMAQIASTVYPTDSGTLGHDPATGVIQLDALGGDLVSACSSTGGLYLYWQRGFAEFIVPPFPQGISSASLKLTASGIFTSRSDPEVINEVWANDANLVIESSGFEAKSSLVNTFIIEHDITD